MTDSRTPVRERLRSLASLIALTAVMLVMIGASAKTAFAQDPTHLRVSGSGWNHFKLAAGSGGLWSPATSPKAAL